MKMCLINNLYKPFNRGGAEKITETIVNGLVKAGHEVFIITTKPRKKLRITPLRPAFGGQANYPPSASLRRTSELRIYYLNSLYHNLNKFSKFFRLAWHLWDMFNFINYFKVKQILNKEKCQAVITNNLMGIGYLTNLAIRRLKLKQIHIVHDIQLIHPSGLLRFGQEKKIDSFLAKNYAGLTSQLFASPKIVIFPSRWLINLHLSKIFFIKSKRIVMPNPVPCFNPTLSKGEIKSGYLPLVQGGKEGGGDGIFKFLYLGQIEEHKGVNLLIQAFKKVKDKFPRIELLIAGSGSQLERAKLEAGHDETIKFLGWQSEPEIDRLLRNCQILVVPTLCYENCPAVILEAFSAGLPVMAADLGGISELIGETAGVLFRPGNPVDLAEKMAWAIDHRDDLAKMAVAGRAKAALGGVENYIKEFEGLMKL